MPPEFSGSDVDTNMTLKFPWVPNELERLAAFKAGGGFNYGEAPRPFGTQFEDIFKGAAGATGGSLYGAPFDYGRAGSDDQAHKAQLALIDQIKRQPSLSAIAAKQALSQGASAALNTGGRGALGSMQALQNAGSGYSSALSSLAQQAAAESASRDQAQASGLLGLRGRDLQAMLGNADAYARLNEIVRDTRLRGATGLNNIDYGRAQNALGLYARLSAMRNNANAKLIGGSKQAAQGVATAIAGGA